jgi:hypothetical protein
MNEVEMVYGVGAAALVFAEMLKFRNEPGVAVGIAMCLLGVAAGGLKSTGAIAGVAIGFAAGEVATKLLEKKGVK